MIRFPLVLLLLSLSAFAHAKDRPELDGAMRKMFASLMNLEVLATSAEKFASSEHREIALKDLETLIAIQHALPKKMKAEEPGFAAIVREFQAYTKDTRDELVHGNTEYARHRVRTLGAFCLSCHTRLGTPQDYEDLSSRVEALKVSAYDKAGFYAATRQFDKAIASYKLFLDVSPKDEMGIVEYSRALREYVRLLVRVRGSAEDASKALDILAKKKDLPEFDRRLIAAWKKDIAFWVAEKSSPTRDLTSEALIRRAERLVEHAQSLQSFPSDENGDVSFLRATGFLHEALDRDPKADFRARALYLLGISYEALQEPFLWNLHRLFFDACVRENPHTEIAKKCYDRVARSVFFNYTGTGGTRVPEDELKKLAELRDLSAPKGKK